MDVTGVSLIDLAKLDDAVLGASLPKLLSQYAGKSDPSCAGATFRLWQNYNAEP
jgi:hypothetical protein